LARTCLQNKSAETHHELALRLVIERAQALEVVGSETPQALPPDLTLAILATGWRVYTEDTKNDWGVAGDETLPGPAATFLTSGESLVKS
jgi:hypothetical protein